MRRKFWGISLAGGAAGMINGLMGAGGGMLLVPILTKCTKLKEQEIFPCSVSIILPICIVSLFSSGGQTELALQEAWPYLLGSIVGGLLAASVGQRVPVKWLHRTLGMLILWGGIRYLC